VLQIACGLVDGKDSSIQQAKVLLKEQGRGNWNLSLFGSNAFDGVDAIVKSEADLAIMNPAAGLMMAYKGIGPFKTPQPVRQIAVIPSLDQYAFAVRPETGISTFEQIAVARPKLVFALRSQRDHCMNVILQDIAGAAGFSFDDIRAWGGEVRYEGMIPFPDSPKFHSAIAGETNALIDEAADMWVNQALDAGLIVLPMAEATVCKLETRGYRRGLLKRSIYPKLPNDYLTVDFSGWTIFCHSELPASRVRQICAALDDRKHLIPWQVQGPLPVERMCREAEDTPQLVPFHPAAEGFWRERGYM
jgi:TRAP-type uncharacterized transport system substrate-binding protein